MSGGRRKGLSTALREWFRHDPARWEEFCRRYWAELSGKPDLIQILKQKAEGGVITLIYGARGGLHNNAVALKMFLKGEAGNLAL
ncbi:MAG TPA: DUF488 family protein [Thermodesulfovibrionales bacterium]|nr:DUF488 family protein [Thermodesulfovibrionales bacterium]